MKTTMRKTRENMRQAHFDKYAKDGERIAEILNAGLTPDEIVLVASKIYAPRFVLEITYRQWNREAREVELITGRSVITEPMFWILREPRDAVPARHYEKVEIFDSRGRRIWWRNEQEVDRLRAELARKYSTRWAYMAEIEEKADVLGNVMYQTGGRDCDQCESTSRPYKLEGGFREWERIISDLYDCAEGPIWFWLLAPEDVPHARHGSRDLALEAFEDGRPFNIRPGGPLTPEGAEVSA